MTGQFLTKIWLSSKLEVDLFRILLEDKSWVLWTTIKLLIKCVTGWGMVGLVMRRRHLLLGNRWRKLASVSCTTRMSHDATHSLLMSWTWHCQLNRPYILMITNWHKFFLFFSEFHIKFQWIIFLTIIICTIFFWCRCFFQCS